MAQGLKGDDAVAGATVVPARVLLHQIADVDNEAILDNGHRDPVFGRRIPHLQTFGPGLLQEDGNGAEVGMGARLEGGGGRLDFGIFQHRKRRGGNKTFVPPKLAGVFLLDWSIMQETHGNRRVYSETVQRIGWTTPQLNQAFDEDADQRLGKRHHPGLVVQHDVLVFLPREVWPQVGAG